MIGVTLSILLAVTVVLAIGEFSVYRVSGICRSDTRERYADVSLDTADVIYKDYRSWMRSCISNRTGYSWRRLSHEFPRRERVYWHFKTWTDGAVAIRIHDRLRAAVRDARLDPIPSVGIVDARSIMVLAPVRSSYHDSTWALSWCLADLT